MPGEISCSATLQTGCNASFLKYHATFLQMQLYVVCTLLSFKSCSNVFIGQSQGGRDMMHITGGLSIYVIGLCVPMLAYKYQIAYSVADSARLHSQIQSTLNDSIHFFVVSFFVEWGEKSFIQP